MLEKTGTKSYKILLLFLHDTCTQTLNLRHFAIDSPFPGGFHSFYIDDPEKFFYSYDKELKRELLELLDDESTKENESLQEHYDDQNKSDFNQH